MLWSFNPRAREGRDQQDENAMQQVVCFNPRAREGRDPPSRGCWPRIRVSIHAPARGATTLSPRVSQKKSLFQSTRPRGARRCLFFMRGVQGFNTFQSTRPRGARPASAGISCFWRGFNPRAREGRDAMGHGAEKEMIRVSIHAPARGATMAAPPTPIITAFQSTRPRGARH